METTMPSGCEVESAAFHATVRSGFRGRIDDLKSRGLAKVTPKMQSLQRNASAIPTRVKALPTKVQDSMKINPMKWAGVAAGAGFAIGLAGRIARARRSQVTMPDLVIIESIC